MAKVTYRDFRSDDLDDLIRLLASIWGYESYSDNQRVCDDLVRLDVYASLYSSPYREIAEMDKILLGVLFACPKGKRRRFKVLKYAFLFAGVFLKLVVRSKDSRRALINLNRQLKACESMAKRIDEPYKNEVTLFMVDERFRGRHIGVGLIERYEAYLSRKNMHEYHLFTDNHCSYTFYDHHGFKKEGSRFVKETLKNGESTSEMMLYTKTLPSPMNDRKES